MRIHQITHLFSPDELAGAALYTDLSRFLSGHQHDVRVTTTFSYYPALHYRVEDQNLASRAEVVCGIPVRRIGMYLPKNHNGWRRLLPEMSYTWRLARLGRFPNWTPDVVITACPMLAQCLAQRFLYAGRRVPRLIIVQDFMVDAALELGILKLPLLGTTLRMIERWALRSAQTLVSISPGMAQKAARLRRRTVVIPNWIHQSLHDGATAARNAVSARDPHRLFYSGNLGIKQGLPQFLDGFAQAGEAWTLDIHGGGAERERVKVAVGEAGNVRLSGLQPEPEYLSDLASATACLITERPGVGANFLPSKLLPALATGTPVLAVCGSSTPLASEVAVGGFGVVVQPGDIGALRRVLDRWTTNPEELRRLGSAALTHAEKFSRERILGMYEQELQRLVDGRG